MNKCNVLLCPICDEKEMNKELDCEEFNKKKTIKILICEKCDNEFKGVLHHLFKHGHFTTKLKEKEFIQKVE